MDLTGKTALVTGGGSGVGRGVALALAREGCRVVISGRRDDLLRETADLADANTIATHRADVANRESVAELFGWIEKTLGPLEILVNNAGTNVAKRTMADLAAEDWDYLLGVNATGAYNCIRAALPQMRARRDGLIVNVVSVAGKRAAPLGGVAYNASKSAMAALGLSVAAEDAANGIRVTNIYPGEVNTPILDERPVPVSDAHKAQILQPEDVAAAVVLVAKLPARANVIELVIKPTTQVFF